MLIELPTGVNERTIIDTEEVTMAQEGFCSPPEGCPTIQPIKVVSIWLFGRAEPFSFQDPNREVIDDILTGRNQGYVRERRSET